VEAPVLAQVVTASEVLYGSDVKQRSVRHGEHVGVGEQCRRLGAQLGDLQALKVAVDLGAASEEIEDRLVEDVDRSGPGERAERNRAVRVRWCRHEGDPHVGPGSHSETMLHLVVTGLKIDRGRREQPCRVAEPSDENIAGVDDLRAAAGGLTSSGLHQRAEHPLARVPLLGACIQASNYIRDLGRPRGDLRPQTRRACASNSG
jgi:hypothetical protein